MPVIGVPTTSTDSAAFSIVSARNLYATLDDANTILGVSSQDADVMAVLDAASRVAEQWSGREFWTMIEARYIDVSYNNQVVLPDCLGVTAVERDTYGNNDFPDALTEDTDFVLRPYTSWPKTSIYMLPDSVEKLTTGARTLKVTGTWGAGDLTRAAPWHNPGVTATLSTASDTTATLSAANGVAAGHTLMVGTEQLFVESVDELEATVVRGVNGTTAAAHTAADVTIAAYPADVTRGVLWLASEIWRAHAQAGYESERIGEYSYKMASGDKADYMRARLFGRVRRVVL